MCLVCLPAPATLVSSACCTLEGMQQAVQCTCCLPTTACLPEHPHRHSKHIMQTSSMLSAAFLSCALPAMYGLFCSSASCQRKHAAEMLHAVPYVIVAQGTLSLMSICMSQTRWCRPGTGQEGQTGEQRSADSPASAVAHPENSYGGCYPAEQQS